MQERDQIRDDVSPVVEDASIEVDPTVSFPTRGTDETPTLQPVDPEPDIEPDTEPHAEPHAEPSGEILVADPCDI